MILHYAHVNYLNLIINIPKKFVATVTCYGPNDSNPHNHRKVTPQSLVAPTWFLVFDSLDPNSYHHNLTYFCSPPVTTLSVSS